MHLDIQHHWQQSHQHNHNTPLKNHALSNYGLDEEQMLKSLDPVVHIASRMFDMPVAAVNMIGSDHVFFAASVDVGEVDMRRDVSFCARTITQSPCSWPRR